MINLRTFLAVGFLAVLTSCGTTKETTQPVATKQETNRGRSNQDNTSGRTKTTTSPKFSSEKAATATSIRNDEARDKAKMQEMYTSLSMNDDQIERFESEWARSTGNWKRSNRNKTMNNFERVEYQDRILRNILDESQFDAYQEWARANPARD